MTTTTSEWRDELERVRRRPSERGVEWRYWAKEMARLKRELPSGEVDPNLMLGHPTLVIRGGGRSGWWGAEPGVVEVNLARPPSVFVRDLSPEEAQRLRRVSRQSHGVRPASAGADSFGVGFAGACSGGRSGVADR